MSLNQDFFYEIFCQKRRKKNPRERASFLFMDPLLAVLSRSRQIDFDPKLPFGKSGSGRSMPHSPEFWERSE
ncbi:hypothetical protein V8G57_08105 [Collimonas sp. H4R21]|uniref:Uncharacterized protein n=1 Tax=Collimonas rhizosphaerae TaxID=3126357 RepID=A0ABU9PTM4_9BURK